MKEMQIFVILLTVSVIGEAAQNLDASGFHSLLRHKLQAAQGRNDGF